MRRLAPIVKVRGLSWCDVSKGVSGGYCNRCGYKAHRPILGPEIERNNKINAALRTLIRPVAS